jgi:hypothetical protein
MMGWAVDAETAIFSRGKKSADGIRPMAGRAVRICISSETWIMIGRKREAICGEGG